MTSDPERFDYDVVVVGGSLVGSAAALFLAHQGLRVVMVERRTSVSDHPRARGLSVRTMELFRAVGIETEVRDAGDGDFGFFLGDTLDGSHEPGPRVDSAALRRLSPTTPYSCDQNRLEPILRRHAEALGATLWPGWVAADVEQTPAGVVVRVSPADEPGGRGRSVTARYLVAADGAGSGLRRALGIGRHGQDIPGTGVSALFDADLAPALRGRRVGGLISPRLGTVLFPSGPARDHHWLGLTPRRGIEGLGADAVRARALTAIRDVVGHPRLAVRLRSVLTWRTGAYVADGYRAGRVFLVGDAAHVMPPYGGFGGNTGIADAHNLAWKLAAVCAGKAPESLLDTYQSERQPIAEFTVRHVTRRGFAPRVASSNAGAGPPLNNVEISLGYCYPSIRYTERWPVRDPGSAAGLTGMRAPHVPLAGPPSSTLDLLDPRRFTLLVGDDEPLVPVDATIPGVRVRLVRRSIVTDRVAYQRVFGMPGTALLVRPDGIVGWRTQGAPADPLGEVGRARADCLAHPR